MNFLRGKIFLPILFSISFLFFSGKIFSQEINSQFSFHRYTEDDGLDNTSVNCLLQDSSGFIWVGTADGLFRFDGYGFKSFRHNELDSNSISQNVINSLAQDSNGNIWIGTNSGGINRFDLHTQKFYHNNLFSENKTEHSGRINSIACTLDGKVFVSCDFFSGVFQYQKWTDSFLQIHLNNFSPSDEIKFPEKPTTSLYAKGNDTLLIGNINGFFIYDIKKKVVHRINLPSYGNEINNEILCKSICENPFTHEIFIGTWGDGIKQLNLKTGAAKSYWYHPTTVTSMGFYNIIDDADFLSANEVWVAGDDNELSLLNTETGKFSFFEHDASSSTSVPEGNCHCILKDRNGIFWFGFENGLVTYNSEEKRFHNNILSNGTGTKEKLPGAADITESMTGDSIFISTGLANGIHIVNRNGELLSILKTETNKNGDQFIYNSEIDAAGNLWFATSMGWYEFNAAEKKLSEVAVDVKKNFVTNNRDILIGKSDEIILPYSNRNVAVLNSLNQKIILNKQLPYSLADNNQCSVQCFQKDDDGHYWVGFRYAICEYDANFNLLKTYPAHFNNSVYISQGFIQNIALDGKGNLYLVSTDGGMSVIHLKEGTAKNYSLSDGLPTVQCRSISIDKKGIIWTVTLKGISRFDPATETFTNYDKQDGLPAKIFFDVESQPSGRIYYLYDGGWGWFMPEEFGKKKNNSPVTIISFTVNGKNYFNSEMDFSQKIFLNYYQNNLSFEFSLLNFSNPKRNSYAYLLEGADANWQMSGTRRQVNYSSLAPGDYILKIKAADNEGVWSTHIREIKFSISPPFWQTWWFRILVVLFVTICVYLFLKIRMRIVRREEILKSNYQKKISELETKALRAQMNPHFIFNCLNSINSFILRNDTDVASEYLTKFSRLIRLVLDNSRSSEISLSSELESLKLFIEMEEMRFANKFEYSIYTNEQINTETIKVPPLIFQPYVENAIWHGLLHKNEKGKLKIEITQPNGYLICVIEDNGIGREAAREVKSKSSGHRKSHGMGITSQRVMEWNGDNTQPVSISDLLDADKKPAGTRVEIKLKIVNGE